MNSNPTWTVRVPKRVAKIILKFPKSDEGRIRVAFRDFELDPWTGDIVKLKGAMNAWRRRVGEYRIFYSVLDEAKIVEITHIKRRTSDTY